MKQPIEISKDELYNLYKVQKYTIKQIARNLNSTVKYIRKKLHEYDIDVISKKTKYRDINITYEDIYQKYIIEDKSLDEVAGEFGITKAKLSSLTKTYKIRKLNIGLVCDYDTIYNLYVTEKKCITEIQKILGCNAYNVKKTMQHYKIPIRSNHDMQIIKYDGIRSTYPKEIYNYDNIYNLYINLNLSKDDICKKYNIPIKVLTRILQSMGITKYMVKKETFRDRLPDDLKNKEVLYNLYWNEGNSLNDIANKYNETIHHVKILFKEYGIPMRTQIESAKLLSGEKSPHWKGINYTLYDKVRAYSRDNLHKLVKQRDNNTCQLCGSHENLHAHHIVPLWRIYNQILSEHPELNQHENIEELYEIMINDERINDLNNLITYCENCHLFKVHKYSKKKVDSLKKRKFIIE